MTITVVLEARIPLALADGSVKNISSITFQHFLKNISINGYEIGDYEARISYDRTGNVLIGMDLLKDFDIHIGKTADKETVLLACKNSNLTDEYRIELHSMFDVRKVG